MKFNVLNKDLRKAVSICSKALVGKPSMPILERELLKQTADGHFSLTAGNGDIFITTPIEITITNGKFEEPILLDFVKFLPALATISDDTILVCDIDFIALKLDVQHLGGSFTVPIQKADEYPEQGVIEEASVQFGVPSDTFLSYLASANKCVDTGNILRPILGHILLDVAEDGVTFVGTDGHSLYKNTYYKGLPFLDAGTPQQILINGIYTSALATAFAKSEIITVTTDGKIITLSNGETIAHLSVFSGNYPKYKSVIPRTSNFSVVLDIKTLLSSLKRVMAFSDAATQLIRISIEGEQMKICSSDIDYSLSSEERITLANAPTSEPFTIGLKGSTVISLLSLIKTESVELAFVDKTIAVVFKNTDKDSLQTVLQMPMLVE